MKMFSGFYQPGIVTLRCPVCRKNGVFGGLGNVVDALFHEEQEVRGRRVGMPFFYGVRWCPNPDCREPILVILGENGRLLKAFPPERLDFEPIGVPPKILASFEEAISCHANGCFRATAIMVRRTLEEICADRGASGGDLRQRVAALGGKILVPKELLEAADELRLLGNDAAHLEAKVYDDVGKEEVEAAIDLAKELLKAVYQLSTLVDRLRALKKQ